MYFERIEYKDIIIMLNVYDSDVGLVRWLVFCLTIVISIFFYSFAKSEPSVWVIDDGERVTQDDLSLSWKLGTDNPIWSPGQAIRLFALRNETVAFQVIIEADNSSLENVTVDLNSLNGPLGDKIINDEGAIDPTDYKGRWIERFVEHFYDITRESGGPWGSLGGTGAGLFTGMGPDALIPVEVAPLWSPYPMFVEANTNRAVWIDVTIPKDITPGLYNGQVIVKTADEMLKTFTIEIKVAKEVLPDWPLKTMLYYGQEELILRMGEESGLAAEQHLFKLLHRHRISPMHSILNVSELQIHLPALMGSLYTQSQGYEGPAENMGDGILSLGTYGGYGSPDLDDLNTVEIIATALLEQGIFSTTDVFVYAIDENCESSYGQDWVDLIEGSSHEVIEHIKIGWTCSNPAISQPVDIIMIGSGHYDPGDVSAAMAMGKRVWIYNGTQPHAGSFMTDYHTISPRVNGWIAALYKIERWFYWESTFWYDWNNGGLGAFNPYITAETFHNQYEEYAQGDGMLLYPGRQVDQFTDYSIGMDGVIASIRLKNWRRGIQDAGYYKLASVDHPVEAEQIALNLLPSVLIYAEYGADPAWSQSGIEFYKGRQALWDLFATVPEEELNDNTSIVNNIDNSVNIDNNVNSYTNTNSNSVNNINGNENKNNDSENNTNRQNKLNSDDDCKCQTLSTSNSVDDFAFLAFLIIFMVYRYISKPRLMD